MPRACTICQHSERSVIDTALINDEPFRDIAGRFGTSKSALERHKAEHLPQAMTVAKAAEEVTQADDLLSQVQDLHRRALAVLTKAEQGGDLRSAIGAIRETRGILELLLELEGRLNRQPINILISAEWLQLRTVLVQTLQPYPDARAAVATVLARIDQ